MKNITKSEAAYRTGWSIELIDYFISRCPKKGEKRKLKAVEVGKEKFIDDEDLKDFAVYLGRPWPRPEEGKRPVIPDPIAKDVKAEAHFGCAICGRMDKGEVAHIIAVAETLNNSPDNLLFLCPNHHTDYDLGHKPSDNLTVEEISAAKLVKRTSRKRMLKYEVNAVRAMAIVWDIVAKLLDNLKGGVSQVTAEVFKTELSKLMQLVPQLSATANEQAKQDKLLSNVEKTVAAHTPALVALLNSKPGEDVVQKATRLTVSAKEVFAEMDVPCPHCGGSGRRGLRGELCSFCNGATFVSKAVAKEYDPNDIDEVNCPRCGGRGQTGFAGDFCAYCDGDGFVTQAEQDSYSEESVDEVDCPHCAGHGRKGLRGENCAYCKGSCFVSKAKAEKYDQSEIDEVDCPRCGGKGQVGFSGDFCPYCKGDGYVTQEEQDAFRPPQEDE